MCECVCMDRLISNIVMILFFNKIFFTLLNYDQNFGVCMFSVFQSSVQGNCIFIFKIKGNKIDKANTK